MLRAALIVITGTAVEFVFAVVHEERRGLAVLPAEWEADYHLNTTFS